MIEFDPTLVHDWLSRSARRMPDKEALVSGKQRWTYKEIDNCSSRFAKALVELGIRRQNRVVILLGNCPETVICLYGILKAVIAHLYLTWIHPFSKGNARTKNLVGFMLLVE